MHDVVDEAFLAGQSRWPGVTIVTPTRYANHLLHLGVEKADLARHGADLYLSLACGEGDPVALRFMEEWFLPGLHTHLARSGFVETTRQDVIQQLLLHLCTGEQPRILTYAGRTALASWLRVVALRAAINLRQSAKDHPRTESEIAVSNLISDCASVEVTLAIESARPKFQVALAKAMASLTERDKTLLYLHFLDGASIDSLGKLYGVHRATCSRWIVDIRKRILENVKELITFDGAMGTSEFQSLAFLVQSELQSSLRSVIGAARD